MKFRTEIEPDKAGVIIRPEKPIVLLGSCFADNIGGRMRRCLWNAVNPTGVLFNPLSIAAALELSLFDGNAADSYADSIFESEGIYHSWLSDSSGSSDTRRGAIEKFTERTLILREMLGKGQTLCVTFGSAFCYFLASDSATPVANCHKQPATLFTRRRVTADEICDVWISLASRLKELFPKLRIIFTVSPVRHVRDGLHENSLSKSTLLLAVDRICRELDFCHYFPAYEILLDDLRDYRFYASDLVHPSDMAVEYIWEKFRESFIDNSGCEMLKKGEAIYRRADHRPIIADDAKLASFRDETRRIAESFRQAYPDSLPLPI